MTKDVGVTYGRPWGAFTNLYDSEFCKVKIIRVEPKKRLSLQSHEHRAESWTVVRGTGFVTLGDGKEFKHHTLGPGESINIEKGQIHRMSNQSDEVLFFTETQTGTYFGEDDIVRYQDDYGREDDNS